MSNLWERFDGVVNAEEVLEAKNTFAPLPAGEYDVTLEEIVAGESTNGLPMLKSKFRTDSNRIIFANQTLQNLNSPEMTAKNVAKANEFVNAITGENVEFKSLGQLAERVQGIAFGEKFTVKVSYATKDTEMKFAQVTIVKKHDGLGVTGSDELPF